MSPERLFENCAPQRHLYSNLGNWSTHAQCPQAFGHPTQRLSAAGGDGDPGGGAPEAAAAFGFFFLPFGRR